MNIYQKKINYFIYLIITYFYLIILPVNAQDSVNVDRIKKLSAKLLIETEIDKFKKTDIDKDKILNSITIDVTNHKNKEKSKALAEENCRKDIKKQLMIELQKIPEKVNDETEWISSEWLDQQLRIFYQEQINNVISSVINDKFNDEYDKIRSKIVLEQRNAISVKISPLESELESVYFNKKDKTELIKDLIRRIPDSKNFFEENEKWMQGR